MDTRSSATNRSDESVAEARPTEAIGLLSAAQVVQIYRRRRSMFFGLIIVIMLLATLLIYLVTPKYTAEASILIDPRRPQVVNIEAVVPDLSADAPTIESEIEVIRSRELAEKLIDEVEIDRWAEFNPRAGAGGGDSSIFAWLQQFLPEGWVSAALGRVDSADVSPETVAAIDRAEVVRRFENALSVTSVGRSRVIKIAFTSEDRAFSAKVANTLARLYVDAQVQAKFAATQRAAEWLEARISDLREKVEEAEMAVETFRAEKKLFQGEAAGAITQQISELRVQLLLAQTDYEVEKSRLEGRSGPAATAAARVSALQASLDALVAEVTRANQDEVRLRALEREATAERSLLELFLNRSKQTEQPGLEQPDARVISQANPPAYPSFPRKVPSLALALVLAVALSTGAIVLAESFEAGFRNSDQIEEELGLPALGALPRPERQRWAKQVISLQDYVLENPLSRHAEMLRSIYATLNLRRPGSSKGHVVLVTSALPGEGKSTFVCSLARVLAKAGHRVLAVDCDFHHPNLHNLFGIKLEEGSTDGQLPDEGGVVLVEVDRASGAEVLPTAAKADQLQLRLASDRLRRHIDGIRTQYDLVLIDTPPILLFADATELAQLSDGCILVLEWHESKRAAVRQAVKALERVNAKWAGVVMTKVDARRYSSYEYGGDPYDGDAYSRYYRDRS